MKGTLKLHDGAGISEESWMSFYFEDLEGVSYPLVSDLRLNDIDEEKDVIATLECMVSEDNEVLPMIVVDIEDV